MQDFPYKEVGNGTTSPFEEDLIDYLQALQVGILTDSSLDKTYTELLCEVIYTCSGMDAALLYKGVKILRSMHNSFEVLTIVQQRYLSSSAS